MRIWKEKILWGGDVIRVDPGRGRDMILGADAIRAYGLRLVGKGFFVGTDRICAKDSVRGRDMTLGADAIRAYGLRLAGKGFFVGTDRICAHSLSIKNRLKPSLLDRRRRKSGGRR